MSLRKAKIPPKGEFVQVLIFQNSILDHEVSRMKDLLSDVIGQQHMDKIVITADIQVLIEKIVTTGNVLFLSSIKYPRGWDPQSTFECLKNLGNPDIVPYCYSVAIQDEVRPYEELFHGKVEKEPINHEYLLAFLKQLQFTDE